MTVRLKKQRNRKTQEHNDKNNQQLKQPTKTLQIKGKKKATILTHTNTHAHTKIFLTYGEVPFNIGFVFSFILV